MESFGYEGWLLFLTFQADVDMGCAVGGPEINVVDFRFADSEEAIRLLRFRPIEDVGAVDGDECLATVE